MHTSKFFLVAFVIMIAWLIMPVFLSAQSIWLNTGEDKFVAIEILKPNFDDNAFFGNNTTFATSAIFLSGRITLSDKLILVAELPFAHFGIEDFDDSENSIGNPYIGLESRKQGSPFFSEVGVRPPLADRGALFVGSFSDFDRFEAFTPDLFTFSGKVNFRRKSVSNVVARLRGGPNVLIPTEGGGDAEIILDYSAQVGYEGQQFSVMGGLTGRFVITEDGDIGDRTVHQLGAAAALHLGKVRPGIHFRLPLDDDLSNFIDFVFGLHLGVHLK